MPEQPASDAPREEAAVPAEPETKLRPSAVPIWFLYDAGRVFVGLIPALVLGGFSPFFLVVGLLLLIAPSVRYSRFRYGIFGNTLVIQGGLFNRWRRVLPRERVQSIDVVQKLRHRAFGVIELRIEAVGGTQTEAALVALLPEEADRIRRWASGGASELPEAGAEPAPALARLTRKDLLLAGVTGGRVAVLAALVGYAEQLFGEDSFDRVSGFAGRLLPGASLPVLISVLVVAVLAISLVLSIALTVLVYWDFTVRLESSRLVITRGLLEHRTAHIPLRRVQAIQVNENFVRRWLGLASLTVVVAGYSTQAEENQESSVLLPLARREKAFQVADEILGAAGFGGVALERPPRRAVLRRAVVPTVIGALAGSAGLALAGPWAAGYALVPFSWLAAWLTWRAAGHAVVPGFVVVRAGVVVRKTSIVPEANLQHLQLVCSMLQQRLRLATIRLHIPGSSRAAPDLEQALAARWFRRLAEGAPPAA